MVRLKRQFEATVYRPYPTACLVLISSMASVRRLYRASSLLAPPKMRTTRARDKASSAQAFTRSIESCVARAAARANRPKTPVTAKRRSERDSVQAAIVGLRTTK